METVKVSVVVPIYNVEKYLPRCVDSLINQTFSNYEIILVNDASPDNCASIIDDYVSKYPDKVIGLTKQNGGLSDARNYGLYHAKGEYIAFIDSDDYVDKTFIEKMYNKAIETQAEIVVCGYYGVDEVKNTSRWLQEGNIEMYDSTLDETPELIHYNAPYAWNKFYKRSLFIDNNIEFPKGWIWEDIPTIYPLLVCANDIAKVDEPLIYYILKREGSITGTYSRKMLQLFQSLALLNDRYKALGKYDDFKNQLLFINMKHIFLRFKEFDKYNDCVMKYKFVKEGFHHLNTQFPGWQNNDYYFQYVDKAKWKRICYKSPLFWYSRILIPNTIQKLIHTATRGVIKARKLFARNNIIKYAYAHYCQHNQIDEKAVLFESFHGSNVSDSPFYMMKSLINENNSQNLKIYFTTQNKKLHQKMIDEYGYDIELVSLNSLKYAKVLATSKYLVNNVSFPPYFLRRKEQLYLNTWHGTPLKTLGKNMVQGIEDMSNMQRNFLHSTHLLYPNNFTMAHMMEDYNLYETFCGKAILSGYPRNSIFMDQEKALNMKKKFHLEDKEVFAYMPTWRGTKSSNKNVGSYADDVKKILDRLDHVFSDNQVLYVNLHSLVKSEISIDTYEHIFPFPNVDNYEFLNCCDVLITDYSSVFFDFSISRKPIVLFMYDYNDYMMNRGTYFDVRDLPFTKIYHIDDLVTYIQSDVRQIDESMDDYYQQFTPLDCIDSSRILNDYFFDGKESEKMQIFDYSYNLDVAHTVFFPSKVYRREDCQNLEKIATMKNLIVVFRRMEFNYILREFLFEEFNDKVSYIIINNNVAYTFFERVRYIMHKLFKSVSVDNLNLRLLDNILPNIRIDKIVCETDVRTIKRAVTSFNKKNK